MKKIDCLFRGQTENEGRENGKNMVNGEWFSKMANTPKVLNIIAKNNAIPDRDPGETGYQLYDGGNGVHLTQNSP